MCIRDRLFTVEPGPAFFCEIKRNVPGYFFSYAETISDVRSLEPSSVTRTSTRSKIAGSIKESRHCSINFSRKPLGTFFGVFELFDGFLQCRKITMLDWTSENVLHPVSYTHLDVYKRQAVRAVRQSSCRSRWKKICWPKCSDCVRRTIT